MNAILVFDRVTKSLLREVVPDTLEQEMNIRVHDPLRGEGTLKVPLSVYWTWQPGVASTYVAQRAW